MVDRPIIFSGAMVSALLAGRKTQTRRLATSPLARCEVGDRLWVRESCQAEELSRPEQRRATTRKERLITGRTSVVVLDELDGTDVVRYLADDAWENIPNSPEGGEAWSKLFHYRCEPGERPIGLKGAIVPSIHMPRWASRLTLIVEEVRVQRLHAITSADAIAEGIEPVPGGWRNYQDDQRSVPFADTAYKFLWQSLHDKEGQRWEDNPDVLVLTFRVQRGNIDSEVLSRG